ncbi:hypothetical protein CVT25_014727 [Psilocybe cyanescens]|uniref:Uncharacterized protein n=1 Tax=Psilocybe cyanescens TaxID=93625 RepID=A0A409XJX7_PSICY|nr:hypothetical protein CVT25_014727 [Psilocybe cyanescens]
MYATAPAKSSSTLTTEIAQFNIKVLLVAPGSFRTEGIYGHSYFTDNPIPAYDKLRQVSEARFGSISGTEKGDPDKAVKANVDVVTGEGRAKGRPWPNYLILGEDAEIDLKNKCGRLMTVLDEWSDVTRAVNFDS